MFDVSMFVTEPTRWEFAFSESEVIEMFNYFGLEAVVFKQNAQYFVIYEKNGFTFYSKGNELELAQEFSGVLNYLHLHKYYYFPRQQDSGRMIIEKTLNILQEDAKLFVRLPNGTRSINIGDLPPKCTVLF